MVGNSLFKIESSVSLSDNTYKSLLIFYHPLIGSDALYLYQYMVLKGSKSGFVKLNELLNSLSISVDTFEKQLKKLNEYKLVNTLKDDNDDRYVFLLNDPLSLGAFINNNVFVRDFIQKTSGEYYRSVISDLRFKGKYKNFSDVSYKLDKGILNNWTYEDEKYIQKQPVESYNFNTIFDIDVFLNNVSTTLFPLRCRSKENLKLIAEFADLYDISYQKMAEYLSEVITHKDQTLDLNLLRYKCERSLGEYKTVAGDDYRVACTTFLMNKQNAKSLTPEDKKIITLLNRDYGLKVEVINYLLEYSLLNCDNRLIQKYIFSIAADLHRNNIETAEQAKLFLNSTKSKKSNSSALKKPDYKNINSKINVNLEDAKKAIRNRRS